MAPPQHTCTACPLVCEDIAFHAGAPAHACERGRAAIAAALDEARTDASADADAAMGPLARGTAISRAASLLASARRVLVTGLDEATLEGLFAACDLAETLGAAVDAGHPDMSRAAGPTIARAGEVTAAWEELRDRADLVIFWHCDPSRSHPRFVERFVTPTAALGRPRRTFAVGQPGVLDVGPSHRHLPLPRDQAVETARSLHWLLAGGTLTGVEAAVAEACGRLHQAVRNAACVAVVTGGGDPVGLEAWSIVHLVRSIAHGKPAFQIPLDPGRPAIEGDAAHRGGVGPDAAGTAAVCTWRYGAAGAIARADRAGGRFRPAECDAHRLLTRGEVDAALVLGNPGGPVGAAIDARGDDLGVVRIAAGPIPAPDARGSSTLRRRVRLRCATALATGGTMLRADGREVSLAPLATSPFPSMHDILVALHAAVRTATPHGDPESPRGATP